MTEQDHVEIWQDRLTQREQTCPWLPEPVLNRADLVARDDDLDAAVTALQSRRILVIHGESGVGKSSLIHAGIVPTFQSGGHKVMVCADWTATGQTDADGRPIPFAVALAHQLSSVLGLPADVFSAWNEFSGGFTAAMTRVVTQAMHAVPMLVLDQFEEFLRRATREEEQSFVDWIERTNSEQDSLKVLISLRSEYFHRIQFLLKPLVVRNSLDHLTLPPLVDTLDIEAVITRPKGATAHIDRAAVELLCEAWQESQGKSRPLSLLQLKSILYTFFWRAHRDDPTHPMITLDVLDSFLTEVPDSATTSTRHALMSDAVLRAVFSDLVTFKLEHCESALRSGALTETVAPQVLDQVATMTPFLFTADFKEARALIQLFPEANRARLGFTEGSGYTGASPAALLAEELATRDAPGESGEMTSRAQRQWLLDLDSRPIVGLDALPWRDDSDDRTSGPWLGLPPETAVRHLARAFLIACEWLDAAHICKVSFGAVAPTISLFHDQLSGALRSWQQHYSQDTRRVSEALVTAPLATMGERLELGASLSGVNVPIVANVRWTRDQIIGEFANLAFVNCDFRNSRFSDCTFDGVVFVNCSLDGTLFDKCTILGSPSRRSVKVAKDGDGKRLFDAVWSSLDTDLCVPKFRIAIDQAQSEPLQTLRGLPVEAAPWLYSPASGVAALPLTADGLATAAADFAGSFELDPQVVSAGIDLTTLRDGAIGEVQVPDHGLAIIGGRVSALMFSNCRFIGSGDLRHSSINALTLAYVGGSSVDFVEQDELYLAIYGSALRGVSFSRRLGADRMPTGKRFQIDVTESALINTWIGSGIRGEFWANHSTLQSLTSLSGRQDRFGITAPLEPQPDGTVCTNQAFVDPADPADPRPDRPSMVRGIANIEYKTAYRSRPAQAEFDHIVAAGSGLD